MMTSVSRIRAPYSVTFADCACANDGAIKPAIAAARRVLRMKFLHRLANVTKNTGAAFKKTSGRRTLPPLRSWSRQRGDQFVAVVALCYVGDLASEARARIPQTCSHVSV